MLIYMYQASLYCQPCGEAIRARLTSEGKAPADPRDESSYDSGDFPKGPFNSRDDESDAPDHCDACGEFLKSRLTSEGLDYVREAIARERGNGEACIALDVWEPFYRNDL